MRAAVYRGGRCLEVEDLPVPALLPGELLVKVHSCGVCGTDLKKIQYGLVDPPRVFGHEIAGVIVSVGSGVEDWRPGDRVALNHHVPCMADDCFYCSRKAFAQCPVYKRTGTTAGFEPAGGGFSQYVRVMDWCARNGTIRVPDGASLDEATFIEPLNTCLKAVRLIGVGVGDTIVVIGQGPIGLLFTMLGCNAGAHMVATDPSDARRVMALKQGANAAFDPADQSGLADAVFSLTAGRGADAAIVSVPETSVISQAFTHVRPAGKVLLFAQTRLIDFATIDAGAVCYQEKALIGSYSSDITLQQEATDLIFSRTIDVRGLITHRFALGSIAEAIELAAAPRNGSLKILVTP